MSQPNEIHVLVLGHGAQWITPHYVQNYLAIDYDWYSENTYRKMVTDNLTGESLVADILCLDAMPEFEPMMQLHVKIANCILFVYDFFRPDSFQTLQNWHSTVQKLLVAEEKTIPMAMLGMNYDKRKLVVEADASEGRLVSEDLISAFSTAAGIPFSEAMHTQKTDSYEKIALAFVTLISRANAFLEEEKMEKMSRSKYAKYQKERERQIKKHCKQSSLSSSSTSTSSSSSSSPSSSRTQEVQCCLM